MYDPDSLPAQGYHNLPAASASLSVSGCWPPPRRIEHCPARSHQAELEPGPGLRPCASVHNSRDLSANQGFYMLPVRSSSSWYILTELD